MKAELPELLVRHMERLSWLGRDLLRWTGATVQCVQTASKKAVSELDVIGQEDLLQVIGAVGCVSASADGRVAEDALP